MNWYYQTDGKEVGSITQSTLRELRSCGAIGDETMVRSEDSDAWQPYSQAFVEATESIPGGEEKHSFALRMKEGAKEGWGGIKRHSTQVALKAQIEKLRNVDLRRVHHDLGKKCFESGIFEDVLPEQFQAIRDLDAKIAEKREKAGVEDEETKIATLKRKGIDAAHASHAQALSVKREHLITELGRLADAAKTETLPDNLKDAFTAIADIDERIHQKESEMRKLGDGGESRVMTLVVAAVLALLLVVVSFIGVKVLGGGEKGSKSVAGGEIENTLRTNSLGMRFARVEISTGPSAAKPIYFSIWETRLKDYAAYAKENPSIDSTWKDGDNGVLPMSDHPESPVTYVNQADAKGFCEWLTKKERASGAIPRDAFYRLPTDHEWSCAAGLDGREDPSQTAEEKSGKAHGYPWGDHWPPPPDVGNVRFPNTPQKFRGPAPVGKFRQGKFGLYDMVGNVTELAVDPNSSEVADVTRGTDSMMIVDEHPREVFLSSRRIVSYPESMTKSMLREMNYMRGIECGFRCVLQLSP